jgi:signal transduction histidine kinase
MLENQPLIQISKQEIGAELAKELEKNNILISVFGACVQFLWTFMDQLIIPSLWLEFFVVRTTVFLSVVFLCAFHAKLKLRVGDCLFFAAMAIGFTIMYTTLSAPEELMNKYVLGDMVYYVGLGILATWPFKRSMLLFGITLAYSVVIYALNCKVPVTNFLTNGGLALISMGCLSVVMIFTRYNSRFEQTRTRLELEKSLGIIQLKSHENSSLQSQLHESEKSSIIGEISASVSHELNTPLSIVVNGSNAIEEISQDLLVMFDGVEPSQWLQIKSLIRDLGARKRELSSMKQIGEASLMEAKFAEWTGKQLEPVLARSLVGCGLTSKDEKWLRWCGQYDNHKTLFSLIVKVRELQDFSSNIREAVDKSSNIIQELKSLVNQQQVDELKMVDLKTSLENAISLLGPNHAAKMRFSLVLDQGIQLKGYEIRMVQMWFKLLDYVGRSILNPSHPVPIEIKHSNSSGKSVVVFRVDDPPKDSILRLKEGSSYVLNNEKQREFNLNILQSLLSEHNAQLSIMDHAGSYEIHIRLPG